MIPVFGPLASRLYNISTPSVYIEDFDFKKIMDDIEELIVAYPPDESFKEIEKYSRQVNDMLSQDNNYYERFVQVEISKSISEDEFGNVCSEESKTHEPLPVWRKDSINNAINFELNYYAVILNKLLEYLNKKQDQQPDKGVSDIKFKCADLKNSSKIIKALYNSLIRHECISPSVKFGDFNKAFGMEGNLDCKITWIATQPSLHFFIQKMFDDKILDSSLKARKWKITKALFCRTGEDEISKNMNTLAKDVTKSDRDLVGKVLLSFKKR
ncbi:hypothetical protein A4H97_33735 [Niastella yeongjuensis]|uniref:Uncharacterized protein n=1 Tax=Niastella yeongjuensis TaxID=354355 RepID=A0A1V9EDX2_9BACT|nr:hypothetical protein [Niastella yeongjuensis]OQP44135.1 hypothetical protein A4H97_33735 [Niastella yeongjuensis]SEP49238.1 hypothetical protein SAMN05660816_06928 [Niastella yeongjuensis]